MSLKDNIIYYIQTVDNIEEVYELKDCFIDLGKRIEISAEEYITSDEEFKYFDINSDTESYDSDSNGFFNIIKEYKRRVGQKSGKPEDTAVDIKPKTKKMVKKRNQTKRRSKGCKTPEPVVKTQTEPQPMDVNEPEQQYVPNIGEQSLLEDDFYKTNMEFFLSQSLPMTQSSALIQQNGRFAYYPCDDTKDESIKLEQTVDHLLTGLSDLVDSGDESNHWPLLMKTITEYLFAFKKSSKNSKYLAHKVLSHYNWSEDKQQIDSEELFDIKRLHIQFLDRFLTEILLNCYSRDSIMEVISGSNDETNAWLFISKLIQVLINESIRNRDRSLALLHFKLIVEVFIKDFKQFLNNSTDYCVDIQRIDGKDNYRPLICRLIWSKKTPNYLNSVFKQLIFLLSKVIAIKDDLLLIEMFKLFELSAECQRIGSGNVRPYVSFAFDKPTPITVLFQQLNDQLSAENNVFEKLLNCSNICWVRLQLSGHFMTKFIVDLKNKYFAEKRKKISLKLIVECLTNAKLLTKTTVKPSVSSQSTTDSQRSSIGSLESTRKRSSIGLINKTKNYSNKEWTKKNKYGENGLHIACKKGQIDKLRELLSLSAEGFGPNPNDTDNAGYTPLSEAVSHSRVDCIQALIEWQNQSNKRLDFEAGPQKQTPLHEAIENNAIECAKLIIESGGLELLDISREWDGKTPKDLIKSQEMIEMTESLRSKTNSIHFQPKINVKNSEDSRVFIKILIDLITSYIETTKIDQILQKVNLNDESFGQELPDIFYDIFKRDICESEMTSLIEDMTVLKKLPQIIDSLKSLFDSSAVELIGDLELILSLLTLSTDP